MEWAELNERRALIRELLETYRANTELIEVFQKQLYLALEGSPSLSRHVHSMKARLKDPKHLRGKLIRKSRECALEGRPFEITPENLLTKINDLAGIRILHLYTRQIRNINEAITDVFQEQKYDLVEPPFARTWDDESREYFKSCGIETQASPSMYTSVHYIVSSASRTALTCEIQVRTLAEELWGEVDHAINYPVPSKRLASQEQIKVLARVTSSATRLVDSIFLTHGISEG